MRLRILYMRHCSIYWVKWLGYFQVFYVQLCLRTLMYFHKHVLINLLRMRSCRVMARMVLFVKGDTLHLTDLLIRWQFNQLIITWLVKTLTELDTCLPLLSIILNERQLRGQTDFEFAVGFYWIEIAHAHTLSLGHVRRLARAPLAQHRLGFKLGFVNLWVGEYLRIAFCTIVLGPYPIKIISF